MKASEPDPRMPTLTKAWCEVIWKEKYGLLYPWSAKDAALLKRALSYSQTNFGSIEAEYKLLDAMREYVKCDDMFYTNRKHPFSCFVSSMGSWFSKILPPKPVYKKTEVKEEEFKPAELSDQEFQEKILAIASKDPLTFATGFLQSEYILKLKNKPRWEYTWKMLADLLGKDRAMVFWGKRKKHAAPTQQQQIVHMVNSVFPDTKIIGKRMPQAEPFVK